MQGSICENFCCQDVILVNQCVIFCIVNVSDQRYFGLNSLAGNETGYGRNVGLVGKYGIIIIV